MESKDKSYGLGTLEKDFLESKDESYRCKEVLTLYQTIKKRGKKACENIVGKGANAGDQHLFLSPKCFPPYQGQKSSIGICLICCLQMLSVS